jgi:hypothetical protein
MKLSWPSFHERLERKTSYLTRAFVGPVIMLTLRFCALETVSAVLNELLQLAPLPIITTTADEAAAHNPMVVQLLSIISFPGVLAILMVTDPLLGTIRRTFEKRAKPLVTDWEFFRRVYKIPGGK